MANLVFLTVKTWVTKIEQPMSTNTTNEVTLCSMIPTSLADSPGTDELATFLNAIT
jgi:hypothetical protein